MPTRRKKCREDRTLQLIDEVEELVEAAHDDGLCPTCMARVMISCAANLLASTEDSEFAGSMAIELGSDLASLTADLLGVPSQRMH
jgi:hypothetical protein